jgi:hypothetical protein
MLFATVMRGSAKKYARAACALEGKHVSSKQLALLLGSMTDKYPSCSRHSCKVNFTREDEAANLLKH